MTVGNGDEGDGSDDRFLFYPLLLLPSFYSLFFIVNCFEKVPSLSSLIGFHLEKTRSNLVTIGGVLPSSYRHYRHSIHVPALNLDNMFQQYSAGNHFIDTYHATAPTRSEEPLRLPSLAIGTSSRSVAETVADSLGISFHRYRPMIQFAAAVNTIVLNYGVESMNVIFDLSNPQSVKSVKQLANTSDVRQRYRINAVIAGEPRAIRPQGAANPRLTFPLRDFPEDL